MMDVVMGEVRSLQTRMRAGTWDPGAAEADVSLLCLIFASHVGQSVGSCVGCCCCCSLTQMVVWKPCVVFYIHIATLVAIWLYI
jgi:hypothetical protein